MDMAKKLCFMTFAIALNASVFLNAAQATNFEVLCYFYPGEGGGPTTLRLDADGNLYGSTSQWGGGGGGTVFKLSPNRELTTLYSFTQNGVNGSNPASGPIINQTTGDLYGATVNGGDDYGVIYRLRASGEYTVLHSFAGNDGSQPHGRLIRDTLGNLYGTAQVGNGINGYGTVFRLGADGKFAVLHSFAGNDGEGPLSRLTRDNIGNFYGTAEDGGAHGWGTVFKMTSDGTFKILYSFKGRSDGLYPIGGLVRDKAGNLYGTTVEGGKAGGGAVFQLAPDGKLTILHSFGGDADGAWPEGDLLRERSGKLYGTTSEGGLYGYGTVFELMPNGAMTILHNFDGDDGASSIGGLIEGKDHTFYGATTAGGDGGGVIYSIRR